MKTKYDWIELQKYYDEGHTVAEVSSKFGLSQTAIYKSRYFETRTPSEQKSMAVITRRKNGNLGHSQETKDELSKIAIKRGFGGKNYRKTFYYNGIILESSYELKVAQELDKYSIQWSRPKRMEWVDTAGKKHHYTPDFYLPEYKIYLDPKNDYLINQDSNKIMLCSVQNNVKIFVLSKLELTWDQIRNKAGLV